MNGPQTTVLLIEDEVPIQRFLRPAIESAGWRLLEAGTAASGVLQATQHQPELIVLDLGLPDQSGFEVIKQIREWSRVPILVLPARGQEQDKVAALDAGADDYIHKPFSINELMARLRVALRHAAARNQPPSDGVITAGNITIDPVHRKVVRDGQQVHLTPIEYKLLLTLARNAGLVMTHRQLLREVWGPGHAEESHYLRIFMRQLRQKLEVEPANPRHLLTETGVGYRFNQNSK